MGSYAECWLGPFYVGSTKNDIDVGLMQLFRSSDKTVVRAKKPNLPFQMHRWTDDIDDDEEVSVVYYSTPARVVRDRLELRGYTLEVAKAAFTTSLRGQAAHYEQMSMREHMEAFQPIARLLEAIDVDEWLATLREIRCKDTKEGEIRGDISPYEGTPIDYMLGLDWYGYPGPDLNVGIRLALEVCSESDEFVYDVTDLVLGEYFSADEDLVEYALALSSTHYSSSGKIIVLTEGRSDTWIICESLQLLYPHLSDYFSFMDFEGARVGGGAGNLANIVKAFAGAGIVNKVVALFDNDTAGDAAIQGLRSVRIPKNIKIERLPELPTLRQYPTIGPSGSIVMDVNGMAASIELYLGNDVLAEDMGDLAPVQWTGYDAGLRKYQGEVSCKDRIQERFRRRLETCRSDPGRLQQTDWSGLRAILSTLFVAFQEIDGAEIRADIDGYYAD